MFLAYGPGTQDRYPTGHDAITAAIEPISVKRYSDSRQNHPLGPLGVATPGCHWTKEEERPPAAMDRYNLRTRWIEPVPVDTSFDFLQPQGQA